MGILSTEAQDHTESVVYFLCEALRSAVEVGISLEQGAYDAPQIAPSMDCAEIADKLAEFRQHMHELWSCEVLMVAKILRARDLATELKSCEPELKAELDVFRLATANCTMLRDLLTPKAQNMFDGACHPRQFLQDRYSAAYDPDDTNPRSYRIAGHTEIEQLLDACEALQYGLAAHYGFDAPPMRMRQSMIMRDGEAEVLLLTDFGEMLIEDIMPAASPMDWREAVPTSQTH